MRGAAAKNSDKGNYFYCSQIERVKNRDKQLRISGKNIRNTLEEKRQDNSELGTKNTWIWGGNI